MLFPGLDVLVVAVLGIVISVFHQAIQGIAVKIATDIILFPFKALRRKRWFKRLGRFFTVLAWAFLLIVIFIICRFIVTIALAWFI